MLQLATDSHLQHHVGAEWVGFAQRMTMIAFVLVGHPNSLVVLVEDKTISPSA